jgi:hypothetical protein
MKTLKPLACAIDEVGVKQTEFDAEELRRFIKNTNEEVFFVETDKGETAPIVVGPLRACLADLESRE